MKFFKILPEFFVFGLIFCFPVLVFAAAVTIQSVSATSILPGNSVSFTASAAGFNASPSYTLTDSMGGTISSALINSSGIFSWVPNTSDIGMHNITVKATDSTGTTAQIIQQIIVLSPPTVSINSVSPSGSITPGATVTFSASSAGFNNPTYSLSDSFAGSSLTNFSINPNGNFSWTPVGSDAGTHNITVTVRDSSGKTASANQTIVVSAPVIATISISPLSSPNLVVGQVLTFSVTASNFINPKFSVSDALVGGSVNSGLISPTGNFSWIPTSGDLGSHFITVTASDLAGHTASISTSTIVISSPVPVAVTQPNTTTLGVNNPALSVASSSPPTSQNYIFSNFLHIGSIGPEVTQLQTKLKSLGLYSGPITGKFGGLTFAAVKQFQKLHNLAQKGYVGPGTRAALNQ